MFLKDILLFTLRIIIILFCFTGFVLFIAMLAVTNPFLIVISIILWAITEIICLLW
jgi:hypothetical protein